MTTFVVISTYTRPFSNVKGGFSKVPFRPYIYWSLSIKLYPFHIYDTKRSIKLKCTFTLLET